MKEIVSQIETLFDSLVKENNIVNTLKRKLSISLQEVEATKKALEIRESNVAKREKAIEAAGGLFKMQEDIKKAKENWKARRAELDKREEELKKKEKEIENSFNEIERQKQKLAKAQLALDEEKKNYKSKVMANIVKELEAKGIKL